MQHKAKLKRRAVCGPLSSFCGGKSFLKNAWDGCGKRRNSRLYKELFVPTTLGTSLGQAGTNLEQNRITRPFAILAILSRRVGQWDNGTSRDSRGHCRGHCRGHTIFALKILSVTSVPPFHLNTRAPASIFAMANTIGEDII